MAATSAASRRRLTGWDATTDSQYPRAAVPHTSATGQTGRSIESLVNMRGRKWGAVWFAALAIMSMGITAVAAKQFADKKHDTAPPPPGPNAARFLQLT